MSSPQALQELPGAQKIVQLLAGKCLAQAVSVAAELGIADLLTDTPKNVEEIAAVTSTHAPALYRLLRALANHGIFAEVEGRRFTMTPLANCLRSHAPDSMRNLARWMGSPLVWRALGELLHSVKTGGTGTQQAFGLTDPFAYFSDHPEQLQVFHDCMTDISRLNTPAILEAYDFGPFRKIVDVGGSHGMLLSAILRRYPGPRGIVFDLPDAIEGARQAIVAGDLTGRVETVAGNFFESVPAGADAYILKQVIHDWHDTPAVAILRNVRQAIQPDGRLLIIEFVVPRPNELSLAKLLDLNMLAVTGGRERTEVEYRELFAAAGFRLMAVHPAAVPQCVIEGVAAAVS
jgi:SAM-dependent methyltransferase